MTRRKNLPPLGDSFAVSEALAAGVSPDRLRRRDLDAPFWGGRIPSHVGAADPTPDEALMRLCLAYSSVAPVRYCFSHVTAARLYRIPLPVALERRAALDVAVEKGLPVPRGRAVVGHRLSGVEIRSVRGLPVLAPDRVWLQLAPILTLDQLIAAGDHLTRRKLAPTTLERLTLSSQLTRGRGAAQARRAVLEVRSGTDSPRETWMRLVLVRAGLPEPVIGFTVHDADGFFVGTPDLAYLRERVALEYEGDIHRSSPRVFQEDIARRELFELAGWRVMRVTDADFRSPAYFVERVRRVLRERAPR